MAEIRDPPIAAEEPARVALACPRPWKRRLLIGLFSTLGAWACCLGAFLFHKPSRDPYVPLQPATFVLGLAVPLAIAAISCSIGAFRAGRGAGEKGLALLVALLAAVSIAFLAIAGLLLYLVLTSPTTPGA